MRRYTDYKDSGAAWLGAIPEHWRITHIKRICENVTDGAHSSPDLSSSDRPFLTVVNLNRGSLDFDNCLYTSDSDYENLVRTGCRPRQLDILYSKDGTIGETCVVETDREFVVGSSFVILRPRLSEVHSRYLSHLLSSSTMRQQAAIYVRGAGLRRISVANVAKLICLLPPLPEQQAIADYLNAKTAQIDRKIDLLTQKAAKYRQLKQALINAAVTRGLDQSVPMKDSGVEWIGEVPAHWGFKRLKDAADLRYSNVDKLSQEGEAPVVLCNYVDVYKNDFIDASLPFMAATANATEIKRFSLRKHDVLVTKDSETADDIAVSALVLDTLPGVLCGYHLAQLRGKPEIMYGPYLFRLFQSDNYGHRFATHAKGITRVGLSMSAFADALTPIPPFDEQIAISEHIGAKSAQIDSIVSNIGAQIDKLKDLRKSLINAAVTGKLRVT